IAVEILCPELVSGQRLQRIAGAGVKQCTNGLLLNKKRLKKLKGLVESGRVVSPISGISKL
ncbi:MAG: hypothetical protein KAX93_02965, partial [Flavobacterium sp.]|nr:hypothetical protein [Flavobacterium sp.]